MVQALVQLLLHLANVFPNVLGQVLGEVPCPSTALHVPLRPLASIGIISCKDLLERLGSFVFWV